MDLTSILGLVLGAAIILLGIGFDKLGNFWDPASIFIVVGGTVFAVLASYPFNILKNMPKHFKILLQGKKYNPAGVIDSLVEMAQLARRDGLLVLEEKAKELEDPFFKQGVLLIVDAMDADKVRAMLEDEVANMADRHEVGAALYDKASSYAPAFGMIGTLIGLINMLKGMDLSSGASTSLGESMSIALVTTFYGCILANLVLMPIAKKLRIRNDEEMLYKTIIIEGILGIQAGDNPKNLKEKLVSYLEQRTQDKLLAEEGGEGDSKKKAKKSKKGKEE